MLRLFWRFSEETGLGREMPGLELMLVDTSDCPYVHTHTRNNTRNSVNNASDFLSWLKSINNYFVSGRKNKRTTLFCKVVFKTNLEDENC